MQLSVFIIVREVKNTETSLTNCLFILLRMTIILRSVTYAYWKDPESKKLNKKYIADHTPKNKELGNDYGNDNYIF